MKICTFFGHKNAPEDIKEVLLNTIEDLIINEKVTKFYVGTHGNFDFMVRNILKELKEKYTEINYNIILAYLPDGSVDYENKDIYPEGIEIVPKRFAIDWRNRWMLKQSDYVITYVTRSFGGAAKFKEIAEKQGKTVINLS